MHVRHRAVTDVSQDGPKEVPPMSQTPDATDTEATEPRVTVEMGGSNILIRATAHVGRSFTATIADAINAATDADTTVVIDPEPIRCDDSFAAYDDDGVGAGCSVHESCRPVAADVVATGIVRLRTERRSWLVDVGRGVMCQCDGDVEVRFLGPESWTRVVAICITPTRLIALLPHGGMVSAGRAHDVAA
jgi:hypothetical protein